MRTLARWPGFPVKACARRQLRRAVGDASGEAGENSGGKSRGNLEPAKRSRVFCRGHRCAPCSCNRRKARLWGSHGGVDRVWRPHRFHTHIAGVAPITRRAVRLLIPSCPSVGVAPRAPRSLTTTLNRQCSSVDRRACCGPRSLASAHAITSAVRHNLGRWGLSSGAGRSRRATARHVPRSLNPIMCATCSTLTSSGTRCVADERFLIVSPRRIASHGST